MNTDEFCWWLHGWFEIEEPTEISPKQLEIIKDHLDLVFNKVTPKKGMTPQEFGKIDLARFIKDSARKDSEDTRYC